MAVSRGGLGSFELDSEADVYGNDAGGYGGMLSVATYFSDTRPGDLNTLVVSPAPSGAGGGGTAAGMGDHLGIVPTFLQELVKTDAFLRQLHRLRTLATPLHICAQACAALQVRRRAKLHDNRAGAVSWSPSAYAAMQGAR